MLEPNTIPNQEPDIRVGIVLPEDLERELILKIPEDGEYIMETDDSEKRTFKGEEITISVVDEGVRLKSSEFEVSTKKIVIKPAIKTSPSPQSGIRVNKVIAGRGFHWKKKIPVFLPGQVECSSRKGAFLLINELPLEDYLMCVATSEMNASCPSSLIESQTIVARSWLLANVEHKHDDIQCDVCNDDCCQRYQGTTHLSPSSIKGALNTSGQVLISSDGKVCDARYSKSCGGIMEEFHYVWEGAPRDYTVGIPDCPSRIKDDIPVLDSEEKVKSWIDSSPACFCGPKTIPEKELKQYLGEVDEEGRYFRWEVKISQEELLESFNKKYSAEAKAVLTIVPLKRGKSGRLYELKITYIGPEGKDKEKIIRDQYDIRELMHPSFLYSSAFYVVSSQSEDMVPEEFILKGAGWGHGVGFCQIGALGMSLKGFNAKEISYHYFPNTKLKKIY